MYIENTTRSTRVTIRNAMDGIMSEIEAARLAIDGVCENYLSKKDNRPICEEQWEELKRLIQTATTAIFNATLQYALTVGNDRFYGVDAHKEGVERMQTADRVDELHDRLYECERNSTGERKEKLEKRRLELADLPDAEALPALAALVKEAEAERLIQTIKSE